MTKKEALFASRVMFYTTGSLAFINSMYNFVGACV